MKILFLSILLINLSLLFSEEKTLLDFSKEEKCISGKDCSASFPIDENPLKVFVSFSMPDRALLDFSHSLEKTGGSLVFQGLPKNSFAEFSKKILELKEKGMAAQASIDPKAFKRCRVKNVPTICLDHEGKCDTMSGNTSLAYTLRRFSENGETKDVSPK